MFDRIKGPAKPTVFTVGALAVLSIAVLSAFGNQALATPSPTGSPGQPGAPGTACGDPNATATPGHSALNTGSPFAGGTSDLHYAGNANTSSLANANSVHAVSQYDIACFQLTPK